MVIPITTATSTTTTTAETTTIEETGSGTLLPTRMMNNGLLRGGDGRQQRQRQRQRRTHAAYSSSSNHDHVMTTSSSSSNHDHVNQDDVVVVSTTSTYSTQDLYLRLKDKKKKKKTENHNNNNNNNNNNSDNTPTNTNSSSLLLLPNVLLIGTQKAGTTSIAQFIFDTMNACRPAVLSGEPSFHAKEVHYFDGSITYNQGTTFYAKHYEHCNRSGLRLDATPSTLRMAERVYETYKEVNQVDDVKIIVVLREPISRELSIYNHLRDMRIRSSVDDAPWLNLVRNPKDKSIISFRQYFDTVTMNEIYHQPKPTNMGMYAYYLQHWFQYFHRKQILLLHYDELLSNPSTLILRLSKFLLNNNNTTTIGYYENVTTTFQHSNTHQTSNKVTNLSCETVQHISKVYDPLNEELYQLLEQQQQQYNKDVDLDENNQPPNMEQYPFPKFTKPNCTN